MDWYSQFPPPSREEAAIEVLLEVQKVCPGEHLALCKEIVDAMPSLGSCTGWQIFFKKDAVSSALNKLEVSV